MPKHPCPRILRDEPVDTGKCDDHRPDLSFVHETGHMQGTGGGKLLIVESRNRDLVLAFLKNDGFRELQRGLNGRLARDHGDPTALSPNQEFVIHANFNA